MPNVIAELKVVLNDDMTCGVQGPVENKMLCYSMLEMAKDAVREHIAKVQAGNKIIAVPPGTFLRPANGG